MLRLVFLPLAFTALLCLQRIGDVDFWWQWSLGRKILEHGPWAEGVTREAWMLTRPGVPTFSLSWAYCLALHILERAAGPIPVVLAKTALILAAFTIMAAIARRRLRGPATGVALAAAILLTALIASQRFVVRPEAVVYPLFAASLWIIDTAAARHTRWIWALPALQVVWVNVHSTFILGLGLLALFVALAAISTAAARFAGRPDPPDTRRILRRAGAALALAALASLATPYADRVLSVPYRRALAVLPDPSWRSGFAVAAAALIAAPFLACALAAPAGRLWRRLRDSRPSIIVAARSAALIAAGAAGAALLAALAGRDHSDADIERRAITELASPWWGDVSVSLTAV